MFFYAVKPYTLKAPNLIPNPKEASLYEKGVPVAPEVPIKVWISPLTPAPFVESVKQALAQWEQVLEEAGWKSVFELVDDETQGYKKINFYLYSYYAFLNFFQDQYF